ncbi:MAG: ATP-binding protein [Candidatus Hydrogenedentota bacterium]
MSWKKFLELKGSVVGRLALAYATASVLLTVAGLTVAYLFVASYALQEKDDDLTHLWKELGEISTDHGIARMEEEFIREASLRGTRKAVFAVLRGDGDMVSSSNLSAWTVLKTQRVRPLLENAPRFYTAYNEQRRSSARFIVAPLGDAKWIQIGLSLEDSESLLRRFIAVFLALGTVLSVAASVLGWLIARRALSGVRTVTAATTRMAGMHFSERVPIAGQGAEVDTLAASFNAMAARIETLMTEMRNTNDNIAHDLRSPIARIRAQAESAIVSPDASGETAAALGEIVDECDRLLEMINTMLDISEAEAGASRMTRETVDAAVIVRDGVEIFQPAADEKEIRFECRAPESLPFRGDRKKIQRLLANLLDNAVKYSPRGSSVEVTLSRDEGRLAISVRDSGPGISESDRARLFDRFYRGDASRSAPGNGLGLSLAKAIVVAHGGEIGVDSLPGSGSLFTVRLPID